MRSALLAGAGGVVAALLGCLCCVGPLLFLTLGVCAGVASAFEPLRPLFGVVMLALLAAGFSAVVSYEQRSAVVIHDPAKVTTAQMIQAVATLEYTASLVPK